MARGWESKSVELQQADMTDNKKSAGLHLSPAEQKLNRKREGLQLGRRRLAHQLESTTHLQHRQMLEQSLAEIDKQLSSFEQLTKSSELK
jgi:hypothetical protein